MLYNFPIRLLYTTIFLFDNPVLVPYMISPHYFTIRTFSLQYYEITLHGILIWSSFTMFQYNSSIHMIFQYRFSAWSSVLFLHVTSSHNFPNMILPHDFPIWIAIWLRHMISLYDSHYNFPIYTIYSLS